MSDVNSEHKMGVVEEGELQHIAKPPSTRGHMGSRAPGTAASSRPNFRQTWSSIAPSLEILSPEEIMEQQMEDLEIEDFGSGSGTDLTDDDDDDDQSQQFLSTRLDTKGQLKSREASSLFHILEPDMGKESVHGDEDWEKDSEYTAARQISLIERDAESEVDSEEEKDIMREIKEEITKQVKAEMKDELALMKRRIEKESGANEDKDDDLKDVEPDLKVAILKMRKLDRILAKKIKKEREVKRQRILLEAKLKRELEELKPEGREEQKEVKVNTSKYLALTLPVSHNAGIRVTESGDLEEELSPPVTPLFQTQVPYEGSDKPKRRNKGQAENDDEDMASEVNGPTPSEDSRTTSATSGSTSAGRDKHGKKKKKGKKKDFIKRNIQLAADAGESIAMTDDEKKRIGDLLADIDTIPEVIIDDESIVGDNPYQITLSTGEGFHPGKDEMHRLEAIDRRLKALLPQSDYESISSTPRSLTRESHHQDKKGKTS